MLVYLKFKMLSLIFSYLGINRILIIAYCIFFTIPYFINALMFYLFGRFVKKNIRAYSVRMSRIKKTDAVKILLNSKKSNEDEMLVSSAVGVVCRFFAPVYFVVMEVFSFGLSIITNNCIIACRISLVVFLVMTVLFIPLVIHVNKNIKNAWKIRRQKEAEKKVFKNEMLDARTAYCQINSPKEITEVDDKDKMREMIQNQLESYRKEAEQDFMVEAFDMSRGKKHHN